MLQTKFKVFLTAVLAVSILTISSCSKDFGNMNTNPTVALTPLTSALLTQVLSGVGSTYSWDQGGISTQGGLYCQYFSETQYTEASRYAKPTTNWDGYYAGNLKDLQTIIDYNTDPATAPIALAYGSNANQIAVARIMKAYIFWFLTDTWGDIPYNSIFQADNNGVVAYTSQQEIYNALFTELDEAVKQFDDGPAMSGDILFNKNITMWKKFANSTRAMMALRLSKVDATKGKSEFNAALSADGGVFETGEMAKVVYPGGNFNSPVYNYYNVTARKDYAVSDIVIDQLYNNFDDRYYVYGTAEGATNTAAGASVVGFPYGLTRDEAISFPKTTWARVVGTSKTIFSDGTDFNVATSSAFLLTAAEIYLARAEAAKLGWTEESVEDNYYEGISENYKQWKIYTGTLQPLFGGAIMDGDDYFYYISQPQIALDGETDLEKIGYEQWVASFPVGWLGWANWRRTGYPALSPAPGLTDIPRRFPYGPNEYSLNTANVNSAAGQYTGGGQSTDSQFGRVWWDVQ